MDTQANEKSTRLTLTGLDGGSGASLMRGPEGALYMYTPQRGRGVENEGLLSKKWKQEVG